MAWWLCLVFSTLSVFVTLYFAFLIITEERHNHSCMHWSLFGGILVICVPILIFGLHLRTRAQYLLPNVENAP